MPRRKTNLRVVALSCRSRVARFDTSHPTLDFRTLLVTLNQYHNQPPTCRLRRLRAVEATRLASRSHQHQFSSRKGPPGVRLHVMQEQPLRHLRRSSTSRPRSSPRQPKQVRDRMTAW
jgi:hypothetical protein